MARRKISHLFIDESGDPGFDCDNNASKYFVISAAYFPQSSGEGCQTDLISMLLEQQGIRSLDEFKTNVNYQFTAILTTFC